MDSLAGTSNLRSTLGVWCRAVTGEQQEQLAAALHGGLRALGASADEQHGAWAGEWHSGWRAQQ
jgi:hypothetical protein